MMQRIRHVVLASTLSMSVALSWSEEGRADAGEEARKLFQVGNAAFEKKQWADAESAYLKAWRLTRTFDVAANLGEVTLHLGRPSEAATYLAYSLRTAPPSAKASQRERTQHFFDEARRQVGAVNVRVTLGSARVTLDGKAVPAEDLAHELYVSPGAHTFVAMADEHREARSTIEATRGSSHTITLTPTPVSPGRRFLLPAFLLGGLSAVGLSVGIGMTVLSNKKSSDANAQRKMILDHGGQCAKPSSTDSSPCDALLSTLETLDVTANAAKVAFAASGALAIGAVTYALLAPRERTTSSKLRAAPILTADSVGVHVMGVW